MSRRPAGALLNLVLETNEGPPLHRQIYEGIRQAVLTGRLAPGSRLASTRATAADLSVSRTTVVSAFAQLMAEGYLVGRMGSGTHVSSALPDDLTMARPQREAKARTLDRPKLRDGGSLDDISHRRPSGFPRPLWPANPSVHAFPLDEWTRILSRHWRSATASQLEYGDPLGDRRLREAIGAYVSRARGVCLDGRQIMIVSGAQQAFFLCAQLLLDPTDAFWMEEPGTRSHDVRWRRREHASCPFPWTRKA